MKIKSKFTILLMIFILFFTSLANANDFSEEDTLYNVAMEEENISLQTKLFIKGYTQYSDYDKFVKFMVNNIDRVMNWSKSQYDVQNYEDAILGYNSIINLVERESELKLNIDIEELTVLIGQAQEQLEQLDKKSTSEENYVDEAQAEGEVISEESIEENQGLKEINDVKKDKEVETEVQSSKKTDVPTLEEILELGKNEYTASGKRKIYMEGYELYPESQEIKERLESTAKSLFELGKKQHRNENTLKVAISYYNDILTMPAISQGTIGLAERYRDVANKGIVYRSLEEILELGKNEYTASGKRKIYMEGYELYPESQEIKERLESTAKSLLALGRNHYEKGNFNSAINYYNDILTMPAISQETIGITEQYKNLADKEIVYRSLEEILELGKNEYTASGKRKIYMEGYELYPESEEIKERLENTAKALLNLGKNHHSKGNFNSAINYYNDILTMPGVSQGTIGITEKYRGLANEGTILKTLEEILELGKNEYTASGKRKIYMEGYELYPESPEIKERLENTAKGLLNLGRTYHSKGNFNSAINYYNNILTMPGVSQETIGLAEKYKGLANEGTILKTLEEILELGKNEYTASGKRKIYMEGYELYPESEEIKERLESTAKALLNLGKNHHSKGNFNSAINYYNDILTMSGVSQETIGLAEKYKGLANEGTILKTLEEILELGKNEYTASGKRKIYMEGYELYPESEEIKERLESTAKALLNLGKNHHSKGNFNSAINYYNDILTMSGVSQETIGFAEIYRSVANKGIVYRSLEEILELGKNEYTASGKRKIYMEGYELYPESPEIKERLENTAKGLLNLGKNHHSKGNFNSAINYYNDILTMPEISQGTIGLAERYRDVANKGIVYRSLEEILELGKNEYTASGKRKIYMEGYELYPESPEIKERLENTAKGLLNLGRTYHSKGNFNSAINYYNDILTMPSLSNQIKTEVNLLLSLSQRNIVVNSNNFYTTKYNTSINDALNEQMNLGDAYPRTDLSKYANLSIPKDKYGWYAANKESIFYHMNPGSFINTEVVTDNIFQFVVLSVSTGVNEKDLNEILYGQGILHGMGSAFAEASRIHSINELYLISHAKLETGNGSSKLAKGVYLDENYKLVDKDGYFINSSGTQIGGKTSKSYKKVYNMFGIGAFDSNPLMGGAIRAYEEGWDTPAKAIIGGAKFINNGYINRGQDTLYKMRWNPENPGSHQYATDIGWAIKQAKIFADFYNKSSDYTLIFDIPQYNN